MVSGLTGGTVVTTAGAGLGAFLTAGLVSFFGAAGAGSVAMALRNASRALASWSGVKPLGVCDIAAGAVAGGRDIAGGSRLPGLAGGIG